MKKLLLLLPALLLALTSFGQTQGTAIRATNGTAFGELLVNSHINATNKTSTNTFAGKFQQGNGTQALSASSAAFGLNTKASGTAAIAAGNGSSALAIASLVTGQSNTIYSGSAFSLVAGKNNGVAGTASFVVGVGNFTSGDYNFVMGTNIAIDSFNDNVFAAGRNIWVPTGASNNFVWNSDTLSFGLPATRSNSFTVNAPGGIFLNGSYVTGAGVFTGNGAELTNLNSTNVVGNTVFAGSTTLGLGLLGLWDNIASDYNYISISDGELSLVNGGIFQGTHSGNGSLLTSLNASSLASGTIGSAVLTGSNSYNGTFTGNGAGLTNIQSTNIVNSFKATFTTNYTVRRVDQILSCSGTNQLLTLPNGTNSGVPNGTLFCFLMSSTTGYGSAIITNANGVQTILTAADLSRTITNGQSLTLVWNGENWR